MAVSFMTYNFTLEGENEYKNHPKALPQTFKDYRNGIDTTYLVPSIDSYLNYLDLLIRLRDKWISTGYLDLGMIPIIYGPSFMHEVLITHLLPDIKKHNLQVYAMPGSSFMSRDNAMAGKTEYWAFRDDVAKFLGCSPDKVTTRAVIDKIRGRDLYETN